MNSHRLRSQSITCPSMDADKSALKDLETDKTLTAFRCPKSAARGFNSTDFPVSIIDQTATAQSVPAVTSVLESVNSAHDNCPTWRCSKSPICFLFSLW